MPFRIVGLVFAAVLLIPAYTTAQLRAVSYVTGLSAPIAFVQDPGNPSTQYVVQQDGRIRAIINGTLQTTDFLNLSSVISMGGERGLLGMALPSDYATSGRIYVNFTDLSGDTVVARFKRSTSNPLTADPSTRLDMLWSTGERVIQQPFSNHNGGNLAFGPDGFLYIGMGDGGSGNDPQNHAQRADSLLGKMLRIDVSVPDSDTKGFAVPANNPFVSSNRPEIWSFGLRNPWRWSFDDPARGGTGALLIADVGQSSFEEVNYEPAGRGGRNYGWRIREGAHDTGIADSTPAFLPLTDPIHDYGRASGGSVTGGFVYRGTGLSSGFRGRYFFGDFISGRIWSIALTVNPTTGEATSSDLVDHTSELASSSIATFGVDASGELYFANYSTGTIFRVAPAGPVMTLDKPALTFGAVNTGSAFTTQTTTQSVRLTQNGAGTVTWTASSSAPWLLVSPASGSGPATFNVSVQFVPGLAATQTGTVTIAFGGASSGSAPIQVTLNSFTPTSSAAAAGSFDTPADGATGLSGSIAVTGWAVDDIEVARVRIFRDPVAGEPAGSLVFIGNATAVEGARPDVQATFPTAPHSSRLGWGYLLLTNFLPGLGDGTYRLHAIAEDVDGHSTSLGTKTITAANSAAITPFGAIDTPDQGGTVSGNVTNFGWVLSRGPRRADPPGGGTVQLVIDGAVSSLVPGGWTSRQDLSALFPASEYPGIGTALGVATFDSTTLTNGVHTIAWLVTDNLGNASGIGSRYFTVSNGSSLTLGGTASLDGTAEAVPYSSGAIGHRSSGAASPSTQHSPLIGRRGFDPFGAFEAFTPDAAGRVVVRIPELGRVELWLPSGGSGYTIVNGARLPLPIGSQFDADKGRFTWNPGAGFVGPYDIVLNGRAVRVVVGRE
jgi:glucose/arabinose dehydrogenase